MKKALIAMFTAQSSSSSLPPIQAAATTHTRLFVAYVVVLLFGALLTYLVWRSGNKVQDAIRVDADARIAKAQAESELARAEIGKAVVEQETLRRENLQLSIKLEEERTARLKIEERLSPRRLTGEQQRTLASKLRPFSGTNVNVVAPGGDIEITNLSNHILTSFKEAGWEIGVQVGTDLSRSVSGILIEIAADADGPTKVAAETLASALLAENLSASRPQVANRMWGSGVFSGKPVPDAKIRITIGKK